MSPTRRPCTGSSSPTTWRSPRRSPRTGSTIMASSGAFLSPSRSATSSGRSRQAVRSHVADRWGRDDWPEMLSHEERGKPLGMYLAASYIELSHLGRHAVDVDDQ